MTALPLRCISLWQPWASAIALGNKRWETRGWSTPYRGPIAIHAARRFQRAEREFAMTERALGRLPERLPFGAIVAIAELVDVRWAADVALEVGPVERLYGDYSSGRHAWQLTDIRPLREPVACLGRQSMWTLDPELAATVRGLAQ